MSDNIADRITREHKISSIGGNGKTEIAFCACGVRCENEDDGDDGLLAGYWRHIAFVTETAVRQQAAAEIEQQAHSRDDLMRLVRDGTSTDWVAGWDAATLAAAEIARGRS